MFLSKKTSLNNFQQDGQDINPNIVEWKGIQLKRISSIKEEVGYWRKANAIHRWMVKNVQNGQDDGKPYTMEEPQITKLLQLCEMVMKNKKFANKLLPTEQGFFWGETEYDDYYYEQIEYTKEVMKAALVEKGEYIYESS